MGRLNIRLQTSTAYGSIKLGYTIAIFIPTWQFNVLNKTRRQLLLQLHGDTHT